MKASNCWLSVNFQAVFKYKREGVSSNCQFCCFSKCLLRFLARPISFCRSFISAHLVVVLHRLSLLALLSSQDREEEKKGRSVKAAVVRCHSTNTWKGARHKNAFSTTCTQKKIFCKNSFLTIISLSYHFSRKYLLLRRLPFCCYATVLVTIVTSIVYKKASSSLTHCSMPFIFCFIYENRVVSLFFGLCFALF